MMRILFIPDSRTLLWLDEVLPVEKLFDAIDAGNWQPPAPYDTLDSAKLNATYQDGIVIITVRTQKTAPSQAFRLNRRQEEVLKRVVEGLTTREIATQLHIAPRTVQVYVAELKAIFQARSRPELIVQGLKHLQKNR